MKIRSLWFCIFIKFFDVVGCWFRSYDMKFYAPGYCNYFWILPFMFSLRSYMFSVVYIMLYVVNVSFMKCIWNSLSALFHFRLLNEIGILLYHTCRFCTIFWWLHMNFIVGLGHKIPFVAMVNTFSCRV